MMIDNPTVASAAATTIVKNTKNLCVTIAVVGRKSHEHEIDGVEHELDAHQQDNHVFAGHGAYGSDGKQRKRHKKVEV